MKTILSIAERIAMTIIVPPLFVCVALDFWWQDELDLADLWEQMWIFLREEVWS